MIREDTLKFNLKSQGIKNFSNYSKFKLRNIRITILEEINVLNQGHKQENKS